MASIGSGSESEIEDELKSVTVDEQASEIAAAPVVGETANEEKEDDDASEMLQQFHSTQETQSWHWEQQWVEIERCRSLL